MIWRTATGVQRSRQSPTQTSRGRKPRQTCTAVDAVVQIKAAGSGAEQGAGGAGEGCCSDGKACDEHLRERAPGRAGLGLGGWQWRGSGVEWSGWESTGWSGWTGLTRAHCPRRRAVTTTEGVRVCKAAASWKWAAGAAIVGLSLALALASTTASTMASTMAMTAMAGDCECNCNRDYARLRLPGPGQRLNNWRRRRRRLAAAI
jgi:hypothetical protein